MALNSGKREARVVEVIWERLGWLKPDESERGMGKGGKARAVGAV